MASGVIQFSCPQCTVSLTVPATMAGVTGPCPKCGVRITAPAPAVAHAAPAPAAQPAPAPAAAIPPARESPASGLPSGTPSESNIRPEPRELPERPTKPRIEPRRSTQDPAMRRESVSVRKEGPRETRSGDGFRLIPFLLFAAIAGMSASVVYSLFYFFHPSGPAKMHLQANQEPTPTNGKGTAAAAGNAPSAAASGGVGTTGGLPLADDPGSTVAAEEAIAAQETLELFLKAPTLEPRLELVTPALPPQQLAGSILGGPLPEVVQVISEPARHDRVERLTEFPFRVAFAGSEGGSDEFTVLVKKRGEQPPKVAVEPFLDLVGGRLATFAATPGEKMGTFHAVIEAIPRCFDSRVPNAEKKFTYKLSGSEQGHEIARAYASLSSELAQQLEQSTSALRWGIPMRATLVLSWNLDEDPQHPFLEVVKIQCLHWNS